MTGIRKTIGDDLTQHRHLCRDMRSDQHDANEVHDDFLSKIRFALPYSKGNYGHHDYTKWELMVDREFKTHGLSKTHMFMCTSSVLNKNASFHWKHTYRHNKILQFWKDMKQYLRDVYIPMYYADILLNKLKGLK